MQNLFKKHKTKILIILAAVAVLTAAFFIGENPDKSLQVETKASYANSAVADVSNNKNTDISEKSTISSQDKSEENSSDNSNSTSENKSQNLSDNTSDISNIKTESTAVVAENSKPTSSQPPTEKNTCTISISCATILDNIDRLKNSKKSLVPSDGRILKETTVTFKNGDTVFDVLKQTCTDRKIHLEFTIAPLYNSVYIEGINNIYEFDCGSASGWMYRVNGTYNSYSCSEIKVKNGDKIQWLYTCDMGKDTGGYFEG
ncbi:MAG: DUF4430 domain-containing protein [Acutalibacteraceae bacterium]